MFDAAAALTLTGSTISNNTADTGGGINVKGALTLDRQHRQQQHGDQRRRYQYHGHARASGYRHDRQLRDQTAAAASTATATSRSPAALSRATPPDFLGGAINSSGKGTISGTEFSNNTAQDGGAIFAAKNGTLTINAAAPASIQTPPRKAGRSKARAL